MSHGTPYDYDGWITVRLTVDSLKHSILAMLPSHADMKASMEKAVEDAVRQFDFGKAVRAEAERVLQEQIRRAVESAVREAFKEKAVQDRIAALTAETLQRGS